MTMLTKFGRLFVIKTRTEAFMIIYALGLGAVERGQQYMETYPGTGGWLFAAACTGSVFLAGAAILDGLKAKAALALQTAPQTTAPEARNEAIPAAS
jgi:hypothetical protein